MPAIGEGGVRPLEIAVECCKNEYCLRRTYLSLPMQWDGKHWPYCNKNASYPCSCDDNKQQLRIYCTKATNSADMEISQIILNAAARGQITPSLSKLTSLTQLELIGSGATVVSECRNQHRIMCESGSKLTGSIPLSIKSLTKLTQLHLQGNQLSGAVPVSSLVPIFEGVFSLVNSKCKIVRPFVQPARILN